MNRRLGRLCVLAAVVVVAPMAMVAQAQQPAASPWTPAKLLIYREEVKPGHAPAHAANEAAWSAAFRQADAPSRWVAMTSMMGPGEAWFLSGYESYEAMQKVEDGMDAVATLRAADDKFSAQESEHLSRTTAIMTGFRPGLSYQPAVDLPTMRYVQVDVVRVKQGHDREFRMAWRAMAEAHAKAKMDEHWSVYEVEAGTDDLTFFFFYPKQSLAGIDAAGPMHGSDAFRDAVGESGRIQMREMYQASISSSMTYVFRMRPSMSTVSKQWLDADPTFWTVKAPEPVAAAAPARKK
ncbi:hypothetical protein TBR22_A20280 [Luteitalea sp. TBR-22]|uniref:hypothetical protein n=1 Tax=Luteitalea sp. TBR-22 TaxID=2802971 RepID=UPI001AF9D10D|nr:hypothetical protein [Luteitalea sp. TBR-22]BCS32805.1 hypothetical protein TBR22_A20280 [Luteitalea sp. TBR-22]